MFGKRHLPVVIGAPALALLALLILSAPQPTYAAACTSVASGAWNAPSTWSNCGGGVPGPGDSATINSGHTVTLTGNVTVTTVSAAGTLDVASFTLTLAGGGTLSGAGTVQGAGNVRTQGATTLTPTGAFNVAVEVASGTTKATGTFGGAITIAAGATLQVGVSGAGTLTANNNMTVNGTLSNYPTYYSTFVFNGSTFTNNGMITVRYLYVQGAAPTLTGAGTWNGVYLYVYGPTAAGTTTTLGGPLTLTSGSLTVGDGAGADTLNLAGFDLTLVNNSFTVASNGALIGASSTVHTLGAVTLDTGVFNPALSVDSGVTAVKGTFGGAITVAAGATLQAGISSSCDTLTANGNVTVNGTLSNYSGYACTLVFNGATFTNNGAITVAYTRFYGSGSQSVGGTGTWTGSYLTIGSLSTISLANDATFGVSTFNIDSGGTLTGSGICRTQGTMTINNSGVFNAPLEVQSGTTKAVGTFGGAITVAVGATLQAGISSSCGTLTANGNVTVNGTLSNYPSYACTLVFNGVTFTNNGSTTVRYLYVQGAMPTLTGTGAWSGVNLYIYGPTSAGIAATLGSPLALTSGSLIVGDDAGADTLNLAGFDLTLNGASLTIASNGTLTGTGVCHTQGTTTINSSGAFNAPLEVQSGTTKAVGTFSGTITVAAGATLQAGVSSSLTSLTANGNVTVNGTLSNYSIYACTLVFNGSIFTNNGAATVSTVQFGGVQTLTGTGSFAASNSAAIQSSGTLTLGSDHQMGKLTINAGGRLDITGRTLRLSGSSTPLTNNAGAANFVTTDSTVVYNGTAAQTVATSQVEYASLGIDNPAGVTLSAAKTIPGTVILSNGVFAVGTNLRLANGAAIQRAAGSLSAAPVFGASVNVSYTGVGDVTTGAELPTAAAVLNDLTIARASTVTLNQDQTVNGALTLTSGALAVSTRTLTLKGPVASTSGALTSAATGTVVYAGASASQNVGPGVYGNLTLDNPHGTTGPAGLAVNGLLRIKQAAFTSASAYHDVQIDAGATLALAGDCTVSGDFTNSGSLNANGHTVTFNGAGIQNLTANVATAFANLTVSTGITLVETVVADNVTVAGTLSNNGAIRKTQAIAAAGLTTFGLTGAQMNVAAQGTLTSLQVDRVDANHPNATVGVRTGRYWDLTPNTGAGGYTVTLTLPHNGLAIPTICRYTGTEWDCAHTSFTPTTVTRSGVTTLSSWAVGDGIADPEAPHVILSWSDAPANAEGYVVWYSATPYFQLGDPSAVSVIRPAGSTGWTHVGGGGNPTHNYYYIVQGVNGAGVRSGSSNRTGGFNFSLTPGTP